VTAHTTPCLLQPGVAGGALPALDVMGVIARVLILASVFAAKTKTKKRLSELSDFTVRLSAVIAILGTTFPIFPKKQLR